MLDESIKWFEKATDDLKIARDNYEIGHEGVSMFFCHQAVEKALKSLEIYQRDERSLSHNLVAISRKIDVPDRFKETFADLNPFYTGFRYPDTEEPELENYSKILEKVGRFLEWTEKQLKK